ncbi:ComEC family competence protein, partial [Chryseobacterium sp. HMWF001]
MNKQPILILTISFILGIFVQDFFSLDENFVYIIIIICAFILPLPFLKITTSIKRNLIYSALCFSGSELS